MRILSDTSMKRCAPAIHGVAARGIRTMIAQSDAGVVVPGRVRPAAAECKADLFAFDEVIPIYLVSGAAGADAPRSSQAKPALDRG
jgi:hypothetical protein